ncbi:thermonuclease family protein [Psychrobacter sanguinis]|uniref:thermonuclease family protein n=1 Tax=Psychrobacter sanguinis TaxID=861445 RepID=UPI00020C9328|nr:thermonuclease family protein [Psychrobacter sanguinis]EGK15358.1 nuclease domain protein [Psychrobacter sp. 1501(2011)]MCD9151440.1 thermonuclease family protein [Psychrobacter sanguinis]
MMPFDLSKFKHSTLLVLTAATLIVACESNSETPASLAPTSQTSDNISANNVSEQETVGNPFATEHSNDSSESDQFQEQQSTNLQSVQAAQAVTMAQRVDSNNAANTQPTKVANFDCPISGNVITAKSVRVIDGDTLEIIPTKGPSERIRLLGIDAPESNQAHGTYSTQTLQQCVNQGQVIVEWFEQDRYQRLLGKVRAYGVDCNLNQIQQGAAWHYKQYQQSQSEFDRLNYANAEVNARRQAIGLWASSTVVAPWDYRRGNSPRYHYDDTLYRVDGASCTRTGQSTALHRTTDLQPTNPSQSTNRNETKTQDKPSKLLPAPAISSQGLDCGSMIKKTCGQMSSCEEAKFQLACGNTRLDGDKDGVPCESICPGG